VTELIEAIEAVAWQATLVTERLNATGETTLLRTLLNR